MRYRVYFIDRNEHVRAALDLRARTAAEALKRSKRFRGAFAVEVWELRDDPPDEARLLGRFAAEDGPAEVRDRREGLTPVETVK